VEESIIVACNSKGKSLVSDSVGKAKDVAMELCQNRQRKHGHKNGCSC
jgi:hypothetical protein